MPLSGAADTPPGWTAFCAGHRADCAPEAASAQSIVLTPARAAELDRVNREINTSIRSMTDNQAFGVDDLWTYPADKGDCEDFVLLKRKRLMEAGWPRRALLVTVVREPYGAGHALLTVVTDRGDYVLDNKTSTIRPYAATPYRFVKRQSQDSAGGWVSLGSR